MGELMKKDYDWRAEIAELPMPTLLLFADHDAVSMRHIAEFFALFGGGVRDAGWEGEPKYARARLAIVPGYTHYNFGQGPDMARVIEAYLDQPTSTGDAVHAAVSRAGAPFAHLRACLIMRGECDRPKPRESLHAQHR